jgi:hypothetical protein
MLKDQRRVEEPRKAELFLTLTRTGLLALRQHPFRTKMQPLRVRRGAQIGTPPALNYVFGSAVSLQQANRSIGLAGDYVRFLTEVA